MGLFDKWKKTKPIEVQEKIQPSEKQEIDLPSDMQQEIEEQIQFCIASGFYSKDEIFEQVRQIYEDTCMDYDIEIPSTHHIEKIVEKFSSNVDRSALETSNYVRLRKVFDELNQERIISIHFVGYTLDDGFKEVGMVFKFMKSKDIPCRGYCFYQQQDIMRAMDKSIQNLYLAFHSTNGDKGIAVEIGERIVELLMREGFDIEWNHSEESRIKISNFLWDKVYDGEDYGPERAIRIMNESES